VSTIGEREAEAKAASLRYREEADRIRAKIDADLKAEEQRTWRDLWRFGGCVVCAIVVVLAALFGLVYLVILAVRLAWGAS
jgi:hypothetical protein